MRLQQCYRARKGILMASLRHDPVPRSALAVAAHPDDIEFMAGGTIAAWVAQGCVVHYLLVTDGAGGSRDPLLTQEQLAALRRREQREAAARLGVASVAFLGYRDAEVEATQALRLAIARVIRQTRPEVVLTFDPHLHYRATLINHPDHIAVGASTLGAVMPLANTRLAAPSLLQEGLEPHDVAAVYLFQPAAPTHWMSLTPDDMQRKLAALHAHASQLLLWDGESCAYEQAYAVAEAARGRGIGCELAEEFTRIQLVAPARQAALPRLSRTAHGVAAALPALY